LRLPRRDDPDCGFDGPKSGKTWSATTDSYASWLARDGITVNAVAPALIETDMTTASVKARADWIPVGRIGRVDEVAGLLCEIATNSHITGQAFQVNGGLYMT
jgi:3-oxoacyl-[acyl-carrier protein] reductase